MKKQGFIYITLVIVFLQFAAIAQQSKMDSLLIALQNAKHDTTRLHLYLALGEECEIEDNLKYAEPALQLVDKLLSKTTHDKERKKLLKQKADAFMYFMAFCIYKDDVSKALEYQQKRLSIYQEIKDTANIVDAISVFSNYHSRIGNLPKALEYCQRGLSISKEMNYKKGIAIFLFQMGKMYANQGNTTQALENFQKGLSIAYELKNKTNLAVSLHYLGSFYSELHNISKALEYYHKAISLYGETKDKRGVYAEYMAIGAMYKENKDYTNSLLNYQKGLLIAEDINNNGYVIEALDCIGQVYRWQGDITKALDYHYKALKMAEELHSEGQIAWSYLRLARAYRAQKNYILAKNYIERSLKMKMYFDIYTLCESEQLASKIDSVIGNCNSAFAHYQQYIMLRDKLNSKEVLKAATREKFQNEYDKQKAIAKAAQDKKDLQVAEEKHKQKIIIYSISIGLALLLLLAAVIFRSLQVSKKKNKIIEVQKQLVESKNKEITDSINYAKRIQQAILPSTDLIYSILKDSFILYKPKDVVSGDFYGFIQRGNDVIITTADCTGHGVPGALMSMIGNEQLTKIIIEKNITQPSAILDELHKGIRMALKQDKDGETRDGMDIALCKINLQENRLEYAGAMRPLWIMRNNKLMETKADKQAIGGLQAEHRKPFTNHQIQLQKRDCIYIFTDGYADQFGGNKGKKFMLKNFEKLLNEINFFSMQKQGEIIEKKIEAWMGTNEQVDDILIVGIKI